MSAQPVPMSYEQFMQSLHAMREEFQKDMHEQREELQKDMRERREELQKDMRERREEFQREMRERDERTEQDMAELRKAQKATQREIGKLGGRLGDFIADMVRGNITEQFNSLGYAVHNSTQKYVFKNKKTGQFLAEADLILLNGDTAVIIEAKLKAEQKDVSEMLERMDIIGQSNDRLTTGLQLIGAIAAGVIDESVARFAMNSGLYVIEQSGEAVKIAETLEGFKARVW